MSHQFRERLRQRTPTQLEISEAEWKIVWDNIGDFCIGSDIAIKQRFGQNASEEDEICKMNDEQFLGFAREVLRHILIKLGYRKKDAEDIVQQQMDSIAEEQGQEMMEEAYQENKIEAY
jgi:hypothetical protein